MAEERDRVAAGVVPNLRYDIPAGLVVFLVALPLCLGIALASDAPLLGGIVAGVMGGLVVAPLSGSQLSVSGPAAGLTAIVAGGIAELGGYEAFLPAVVLAGVMQIVLGLLKGGILANIFPLSVVDGMLAGIGVILILKQIPHALGRDNGFEGDMNFWMFGHQSHTFSEIEAAVRSMSPGIVIVTLACLAILMLWKQPFIANKSWSTLLPGPLAAVLLGVAINEFYKVAMPAWEISAAEKHLVSLPIFTSPLDAWSQLPAPDWSGIMSQETWIVAITIAAVASLETLLSVEAVDKLDPFRRTSKNNQELVAQGVGNAASGLLGGLPLTAVIVRSSTNVYSGGRTKMSAFVHGIFLVGLVLSVPFLLNRIPLAALAAVLLTIGYKLSRAGLYTQMYKAGADQFIPFIVTVLVTVFSDLLTGVLVGLFLGIIMVLITNYHSSIVVETDPEEGWLIKFTSNVNFLDKAKIRKTFASIPDGAKVVIDGELADHIDHDILSIVEDFESAGEFRDITVVCRGLDSKAHPIRLPGL